MRATGRSTVHGPAGKSCVSVRQPSAAAAIDKDRGSDPGRSGSGATADRSAAASTRVDEQQHLAVPAQVDEPRLRVCGLGASSAGSARGANALGRRRPAQPRLATPAWHRRRSAARPRRSRVRLMPVSCATACRRLSRRLQECIWPSRNVIRQAHSARSGNAHIGMTQRRPAPIAPRTCAILPA